MNEKILRIIKLADKAIETTPCGPWNIPDEFCEKFAELIIQECINTVQKRYMGDNNREDVEVLRCVSELKNHFGVAE